MVTKTVTVGFDGSSESRAALRWAAGYAEAVGATIKAVAVWDLPMQAIAPGRMTAESTDVPMADDVRVGTADRLIDALVESVGTERAELVDKMVVRGDPGPVLLEESAGSDLLVLGNPHHGALVGAMTGSVALHCVHHADCPVVLVAVPAGDPQA